ncbi:MAG: hypothetical protein JNJ45_05195 [Chthonomonas sp.]|nr:hypothetical protein [Chthonomonas sp.]
MSPLLCLAAIAAGPTPPIMRERQIGPPTEITGGKVTELNVGDLKATLFVPDGYRAPRKPEVWIHFHSAPWFVVSEYQRAKWRTPVVICNFGQGSTVYGKPFTEIGSFRAWREQIDAALGKPTQQWGITSFSAGFGAVRNLIQDPALASQLKTVILADSLYGSLDPAVTTERKPLPAHLSIWDPIVQPAIAGKMTVIMTTTQITPETYAGTWEVARGLVEKSGGTMREETASTEEFALLRTYQKGRWFVWSYNGITPMAHMTHPRHLAELLIESQRR